MPLQPVGFDPSILLHCCVLLPLALLGAILLVFCVRTWLGKGVIPHPDSERVGRHLAQTLRDDR